MSRVQSTSLLTLALVVSTTTGARAQAPAPPAKRPATPAVAPTPEKRRALRIRPEPRARPHRVDAGQEDAVPPLDTDPFQPPKGDQRPPSKTAKHRIWFVRPAVLFVARLSKNRSFVPREGFGFGIQAGATLGKGTLRLSLAVAYHFYRVARTMDIVVNNPDLTSCTAIRTLAYHLATGSVQASASFSRVSLWAGLRGGFANTQLKTPTSSCDTDDGNATTGALGPELGIGYALRDDLHIGVSLAYLHFFTDKAYTTDVGTTHRYFYDMITAGAALTLRF